MANTVIVVTGTPRSGTSMMMQTLKLLGVEIVGEKFSEMNVEKHNRKGFWELPVEEIRGGVQHDDYKGKAVKLFGEGLWKTDPKRISLIICCCRTRNWAVKSFKKLMQDTTITFVIPATRASAEHVYEQNLKIVDEYMAQNTEIPVLHVDFGDMLKKTAPAIRRVADFLELDCDIEAAVENVGV